MTNMPYNNEDLFRIAKANYETLLVHCLKLREDGYWSQPEQMLKQTIQEALELYVQSFLLLFAVSTKGYSGEQRRLIEQLTKAQNDSAFLASESTKERVTKAEKILAAPPILLQLFALKDREKRTNGTIMFIDTLLNIIIALSYLEDNQGAGVVSYLNHYFERIAPFLSAELEFLKAIDQRYVFRKITSATFETGYLCDETEYVQKLVEKSSPRETSEGLRNGEKRDEIREEKDCNKVNQGEQLESWDLPRQESTVKKSAPAFAMNPEEKERATAQAKLELEKARDAKKAAAVERLMGQLEELVGLDNVKTEMRSLVNLIKVRKMRANYHMPQMDMSYHMVFTGNAGTGKTTVARLVAEIYKELGVLSKGTFVETDRAGLVAGYLGQTAMKVKEVVEKAKGGVLFIDEAYALCSRDATDDYGIEAIDTLVKEMEDNRNDLVVIVAGYRKEMEHFLKSNTGLVSRFNKYIDFPDYTEEQLVSIMKVMAKKAAMNMEEDGIEKLRTYLSQLSAEKRQEFGNARGIRNAFEKIITNQANRLVQVGEPTMEQLSEIKKEDVCL